MKILIVQDYLRSGGTERQSVLLASAFAGAGHDTHLITFRPAGALWPVDPPPGLTLTALQRRDTKLDWWAPGLVRHATDWAPDVVLCMGRMANCYGGSLQTALPNAAVLSTMRTGKALPWAFRRALQITRHTIANSHAAATHLSAQYKLPRDRISVIPNGLVFAPPDSSQSARSRASLRREHGVAAHEVVLLDVAMFRPEKNQIALIELAARLPPELPWRLWLVGEGPALAACRRRTYELKLTDRVTFLGWMENPLPAYAAADIAVHASRRESLSNFLIEAQAHGLPAVAFSARGVDETFIDGESGHLIPSDDLDAFSTAVVSLLRDESQRREMGQRGRDFATARFSTAAQAKAHLDLFEKLASLPSPS